MTERGVWRAPGRANLMGEHTDYNAGLVLPFALSRGVTATVALRDDGLLVLSSQQSDEAVRLRVDSLAPGEVTGWAAYPAGVAWALLSAGREVRPASIDVDSDLPQGAGLSSSAALECAVALALTELTGQDIPREELARIARHAETDFVGVPVGLMDQSASLLSTVGHALLLDCRTLETSHVPFSPAAADATAIVVNTRAEHALTTGEFALRQAECAEAARQLDVPALGHLIDPGAAERLADPLLRRRARHVISEDARVRTVVALLTASTPPTDGTRAPSGDKSEISDIYRQIGGIMVAAHASLRDDFEVSWPEANVTVETALAEGALGARMIGAGFGGSVLMLVPERQRDSICAAITDAYRIRDWHAPEFIDATPSASATRVE